MKVDVYRTYGTTRFVLNLGEFSIPRFLHSDVTILYQVGKNYGKEKLQEELILRKWEMTRDKYKFYLSIPSTPVHFKRIGKSSVSFFISTMSVNGLSFLELKVIDSDPEERYMGSYIFNSKFGIDLKSEYINLPMSFDKEYFEILWIFYNHLEINFNI